jgi:hypothetical protein
MNSRKPAAKPPMAGYYYRKPYGRHSWRHRRGWPWRHWDHKWNRYRDYNYDYDYDSRRWDFYSSTPDMEPMMSGRSHGEMPEEYTTDNDVFDAYQQGFMDGWAAAMEYFMANDQDDAEPNDRPQPFNVTPTDTPAE